MRRTNYRPAQAIIDTFFQDHEAINISTFTPAQLHRLYDRLTPVLWQDQHLDSAQTVQRRMRNLLVYLQRSRAQTGSKGATKLVREASALALEKRRGSAPSAFARAMVKATQQVNDGACKSIIVVGSAVESFLVEEGEEVLYF